MLNSTSVCLFVSICRLKNCYCFCRISHCVLHSQCWDEVTCCFILTSLCMRVTSHCSDVQGHGSPSQEGISMLAKHTVLMQVSISVQVNNFLCALAWGKPQCLEKYYFEVCLWCYLWRKLTFQTVAWVKRPCYLVRVGVIQSVEGPNKTRFRVKVVFMCSFKLGRLSLRFKHPKFSGL